MELVEVVARIGDTVLDVAHLRPGEPYRIGTREVFDAGPSHPTVQVGLVTLTIRRVTLEMKTVPRPRRELRPYVYLVASLIVQIAIWLTAVTIAPFEKLAHRVPRIAHVTHVHEPPPLPPPPPPAPKPKAAASAAGPVAQTRKPEFTPRNPGEAMAHLAKTIGEIHVADMLAQASGPVDPDAAINEQNFGGGGHRFNADAVAPEKTYAVGTWALPTYFHVKGELAPIPSITLCDDGSCSVEGPRDMQKLLAQLIAHEPEIAMCYREHTGDLVGTIRIRFVLSPEGKVTGEYGKPDGPVGYGTGTVGRCVAKLAARLRWGQAPDEARVFIGMAFRPV